MFFVVVVVAACPACNRSDSNGKAKADSTIPFEPAAPDGNATRHSGPARNQSEVADSNVHVERTDADKAEPRSLLSTAQAAFQGGDLDLAAKTVREHLLASPNDVVGLFLAAQIEAARGRFSKAVELLDEIPRDYPQAGIAALGQSADWLLAAQRYDEAEQRFDEILSLIPDASVAHRRLAYLQNRQGRRQEASQHVRQLCRAGDVSQAELHTLIDQCSAVYDESVDERKRENTVGVAGSFAPIGPVAQARILSTQGQFKQALQQLHEDMVAGSLPAYGQAFYGRLAMEIQDEEFIALWLESFSEDQKRFADYWVAYGTWMLQQGENIEGATRALAEGLIRNPTDWVAMTRLETCMDLTGDADQKMACRTRATLLRKSIHVNNRIVGKSKPKPADLSELADVLDTLQRPLEAVMWRAIAVSYEGGPQQRISELNVRRRALLQSDPPEGIATAALAGLDLQKYPMPQDPRISEQTSQRAETKTAAPGVRPAFADVANSMGVAFQYLNAQQPKLRDLQLYEQFGGGIVALDFDLDGWVDLYFNQGGRDPKRQTRDHDNVLFRNLVSSFQQCPNSHADDRGYGQGVSSGDWNQDGFADLVIANFGVNTLLINNGDGTFRQLVTDGDWEHPMWTASIAMADVTGDALPDIVEANYIDDPAIHEITPKGANGRFVKFKGPESYRAARDRIFVNQPDGSMSGRDIDQSSETLGSHGLGIVVTDFDGAGGNEIFVANDTDPNQLWFRTTSQTDVVYVDRASVLGCAFSSRGGSGASMGVATGDFDRNGMIDLHVTNFYNEPVHLYMQNESRAFRDMPVKSDLYQPSNGVLGFGTQTLDFDNNGAPDLAVLNGHIDDLQFKGSPHRMLPQLFTGLLGRFELSQVDDSTGYWTRPSIGRGLVRLDFNRDGRVDLVATHHDVPAALLENQTKTNHHWLQLQLVGTKSERDAIGARAVISANDQTFVDVVTAGDGYACKNESILAFGLGTSDTVDSVTIRWPSGDQQTFGPLAPDERYLLVEGQPEAFRCQGN